MSRRKFDRVDKGSTQPIDHNQYDDASQISLSTARARYIRTIPNEKINWKKRQNKFTKEEEIKKLKRLLDDVDDNITAIYGSYDPETSRFEIVVPKGFPKPTDKSINIENDEMLQKFLYELGYQAIPSELYYSDLALDDAARTTYLMMVLTTFYHNSDLDDNTFHVLDSPREVFEKFKDFYLTVQTSDNATARLKDRVGYIMAQINQFHQSTTVSTMRTTLTLDKEESNWSPGTSVSFSERISNEEIAERIIQVNIDDDDPIILQNNFDTFFNIKLEQMKELYDACVQYLDNDELLYGLINNEAVTEPLSEVHTDIEANVERLQELEVLDEIQLRTFDKETIFTPEEKISTQVPVAKILREEEKPVDVLAQLQANLERIEREEEANKEERLEFEAEESKKKLAQLQKAKEKRRVEKKKRRAGRPRRSKQKVSLTKSRKERPKRIRATSHSLTDDELIELNDLSKKSKRALEFGEDSFEFRAAEQNRNDFLNNRVAEHEFEEAKAISDSIVGEPPKTKEKPDRKPSKKSK